MLLDIYYISHYVTKGQSETANLRQYSVIFSVVFARWQHHQNLITYKLDKSNVP